MNKLKTQYVITIKKNYAKDYPNAFKFLSNPAYGKNEVIMFLLEDLLKNIDIDSISSKADVDKIYNALVIMSSIKNASNSVMQLSPDLFTAKKKKKRKKAATGFKKNEDIVENKQVTVSTQKQDETVNIPDKTGTDAAPNFGLDFDGLL